MCIMVPPIYVYIMEQIRKDYLCNSSLLKLTDDARVQCLRYKYNEGSHNPTSHTQFETIFRDLCSLHAHDFVHGDIRSQNLVFSSNGEGAWMIDFDLAGKEGSRYPRGYNHHGIDERHQTAMACYPRKKVHDLHGLQVIIKGHFQKFPELTTLLRKIERIITTS